TLKRPVGILAWVKLVNIFGPWSDLMVRSQGGGDRNGRDPHIEVQGHLPGGSGEGPANRASDPGDTVREAGGRGRSSAGERSQEAPAGWAGRKNGDGGRHHRTGRRSRGMGGAEG